MTMNDQDLYTVFSQGGGNKARGVITRPEGVGHTPTRYGYTHLGGVVTPTCMHIIFTHFIIQVISQITQIFT